MDWLASLEGTDLLFAGAAAVGGVFFLSWVVLQFVGGLGGDVDVADPSDLAGDADLGFKVLSFQSISGFLLMFGLVGLGASREAAQGFWMSLGLGTAAGVGTVWLLARLFGLFQRLQASGTLDLEAAIGAEGSVYLTIPPGGVGKVQVTVAQRLLVLDARAEGDQTFATGAPVRVRRVIDGRTLVVEAVPRVAPALPQAT